MAIPGIDAELAAYEEEKARHNAMSQAAIESGELIDTEEGDPPALEEDGSMAATPENYDGDDEE